MEVNFRDTRKVLTNEQLDEIFNLIISGKETFVHFYYLPSYEEVVRYSNKAGKYKLEATYESGRDFLTVRQQDRDILKRYFDGMAYLPEGRNSIGKNRMGCSAWWYDPYYTISQTFTSNEVDKMSDTELGNLVRLAQKIQGAIVLI